MGCKNIGKINIVRTVNGESGDIWLKTVGGESLIGEGNIEVSGCKGYNFALDLKNDKVILHITQEDVERLIKNNIKSFLANYSPNAIVTAGIYDKKYLGVIYEYMGNFLTNNAFYCDLYYDAESNTYVGKYSSRRDMQFATVPWLDSHFNGMFVKPTGLKTINNQSLVGSGNIEVNAGLPIIYESGLVTIQDDLKVEGFIKAPNNTIEAKQLHATSSSIFDSGVTVGGRLTVNGITQPNSGATNYFEGKSYFSSNLVPNVGDVNLGDSDSYFRRGYIQQLITDSIKCRNGNTTTTVMELKDGETHFTKPAYISFDKLYDSRTNLSLQEKLEDFPIQATGTYSGVQATGDTHTNYAEYSNSLALGVCSVVTGDRGFGVGTGIQAIYLSGSDTTYTIDYITNNERWSTMVNYIDPTLFVECVLYDADFKPAANVVDYEGGFGDPIKLRLNVTLGSATRKRFFLSSRTGTSVVNFGSNLADGRQSLVSGLANYNTAQYSNVLGAWNVNTANYSSVLGYSNVNTGVAGVVEGMFNVNSGANGGVILGHSNESLADYNTVIGLHNSADCVQSVLIGTNITSGASFNTLVGYGLRSADDLKTVIGSYNAVDDNAEDDGAAFVVGIGTSNNERKNGLVIYSDGTILGQDGKHVTYTEDVEKLIAPTTPNIIVYGNPTIANGRISQFSAHSYAQFPFLVDLKDKDFAIEMNITTGANVTTQQNILDSSFGLAFAIRNGQFVLALSYDGTSWSGEHTGGTVTANTTYDIAIIKAGAAYTVMTSTDNKKTWQYPIIFDEQQSPYPRTVIIGKDTTGRYPFTGSIDLNKCQLSVNSQYVWRGMGDIGLLTRLDTSLSNIDAEGVDYINNLIDAKIGDIDNALKYILGDE